MLQLILSGLALLMSLLGFSQTENKSLSKENNESECNNGSGTNTLDISSNKNKIGMQKFNYKKITSTDLIFEIAIKDMSKEEQIGLFGKAFSVDIDTENISFFQEEDFVFDLNTMLYLELDPSYPLLRKGAYPLRLRDEKVQVLLSLSPNRQLA